MFVSPMLLKKTEDPFDDDNWLSELKLDGIRFLYSTMEETQFYSRHNNEVTDRFPELMNQQVPPGTILDGEIVRPGEDGRPDFEDVLSRFQVNNPKRIPIVSKSRPVTYCVFDVIYYKGKNISHWPLTERKEILNEILPEDSPRFTKTLSMSGNGKTLFDLVKNNDLEGIVLKKKNSTYEIGKRSMNWLKVINYKYATVSIAGIRKSQFGWLLRFPDGRIAGVMELGVPADAKKAVYRVARTAGGKETKDYLYLPSDALKCNIKYRALSKSGLLRLPSFVRFAS